MGKNEGSFFQALVAEVRDVEKWRIIQGGVKELYIDQCHKHIREHAGWATGVAEKRKHRDIEEAG